MHQLTADLYVINCSICDQFNGELKTITMGHLRNWSLLNGYLSRLSRNCTKDLTGSGDFLFVCSPCHPKTSTRITMVMVPNDHTRECKPLTNEIRE